MANLPAAARRPTVAELPPGCRGGQYGRQYFPPITSTNLGQTTKPKARFWFVVTLGRFVFIIMKTDRTAVGSSPLGYLWVAPGRLKRCGARRGLVRHGSRVVPLTSNSAVVVKWAKIEGTIKRLRQVVSILRLSDHTRRKAEIPGHATCQVHGNLSGKLALVCVCERSICYCLESSWYVLVVTRLNDFLLYRQNNYNDSNIESHPAEIYGWLLWNVDVIVLYSWQEQLWSGRVVIPKLGHISAFQLVLF